MEPCPSCGALPKETKSYGPRYFHHDNCELGKLNYLGKAGEMADHTNTMVLDLINRGVRCISKCSKCGSIAHVGHFPGQSFSHECSICWAIAKADRPVVLKKNEKIP